MNNIKDIISILASVLTIGGFFVILYLFKDHKDSTIVNSLVNILYFIVGGACATLFNNVSDKFTDKIKEKL